MDDFTKGRVAVIGAGGTYVHTLLCQFKASPNLNIEADPSLVELINSHSGMHKARLG